MSTLHKHNGQVFDQQFPASGAWYKLTPWPPGVNRRKSKVDWEFRALFSCECPECQAKGETLSRQIEKEQNAHQTRTE